MLKTTFHLMAIASLVAVATLSQAAAEELLGDSMLNDKDYYDGGVTYDATGGLCLDVFFAGDGWATRADDDDANNFGFRTGLNSSIGVWNGIRGQLGASIGGYDLYGRDDGPEQATEMQVFVTAGAFKRADLSYGERVSWGIVWDYMSDNRFGEDGRSIDLNQARALIGYALDDCNEVGLWGAFGLDDDRGRYYRIRDVEPMNQYNVYWRRLWEFGGETMLYTGIADDRFDQGQWVLGLNGRVPLNRRTSLFGGVNYIIPSTSPGDYAPNGVGNSYAEESWNVTFGVVWTFGPGSACGQNAPLLPVANNGSFVVAAPSQ